MNALIPPLMPGEKIHKQNDLVSLYPKYDDSGTVKAWYAHGQNDSEVLLEVLVADGNEAFYSDLQTIVDIDTGLSRACILGKNDIYLISKDPHAPKLLVEKIKRPDAYCGKSGVAGCFLETPIHDYDEKGALIAERRLYCLTVPDDPLLAIVYDMDDATFCRSFKLFEGVSAQNRAINAFSVYKANQECHFLFSTSIWSALVNGFNQPTLFSIPQKFFLNKKSIKRNDFSSIVLDSSLYLDNCYLLEDVLIDYAYHNQKDYGAQQIIVQGRSWWGHSLRIYVLEQASDGSLTVISDAQTLTYSGGRYRVRNFSYFYPTIHTSMRRYTMQPSISPDGHFDIFTFREGYRQKPLMGIIPFSLFRFDPETRKLSVIQEYCLELDTTLDGNTFGLPTFTKVNLIKKVVNDASFVSDSLFVQTRVVCLEYDEKKYSAKAVDHTPILTMMFKIPLVKSFISDSGREDPHARIAKFETQRSDDVFGTNAYILDDVQCSTVQNKARIYGALVDYSGESVVLGRPELQVSSHSDSFQPFGLYRALPFQKDVAGSIPPSISISSSKTVITGLNKSTSSSWSNGYNFSSSQSAFCTTISEHYGKMYGGSKMHMSSDTKSKSMHITSGISQSDLVHGYDSIFYLWVYPVYLGKNNEPLDAITVLIPVGFNDAILEASDPRLCYEQDYEIGQILTYLNSDLPGYDDANLWFDTEELSATSDTQGGGNIVSYDKNNSTHKEEQESKEDSMNAGASIGIHANIFGVVNINFNASGFVSQHSMNNSATSTSRTDDLNFMVHSGTVSDDVYGYSMVPVIYTHKETNVLIIACKDLVLSGPGWKDLFGTPKVILMRTYPFTTDPKYLCFSRSIQFIDRQDDAVDIKINVFNNSLVGTGAEVSCQIYNGMAIYTGVGTKPDLRNCQLIETLTAQPLDAVQRYSFSLKNQKIKKGGVITVMVGLKGFEETTGQYYWNTYPSLSNDLTGDKK